MLRCDVGVLLVHGIGSQGKGSTLVHHAQNLVRWLGRANQYSAPDLSCRVLEANIVGPRVSHLELDLEVDGARHRVLLAESHWAESFIPPSGRQTLSWLFVSAPPLVLVRSVDGLRGAWRIWWSSPLQWWRILAAVAVVVVSLPALLLVLAILLASVTIRLLVPIKFIQDALGRAESLLSEVLGDSYVYSADPVQLAAVTSALRTDLAWVRERSGAQMVIAHSQGAALAVETLRGEPESVSLVTLGSGLEPLQGLRSTTRLSAMRITLMWSLGFLLACAYLVSITLFVLGIPLRPQIAAVLGLGGWYWFAIGIAFLLAQSYRMASNAFAPRPIEPVSSVATWFDFTSTADLVSAMPYPDADKDQREQFLVRNRNSVLGDHSSYTDNDDEYWPRVVAMLLDLLAKPGEKSAAASLLSASADRLAPYRHRQGRWQVGVRVISVVVGFAAVASDASFSNPLVLGLRTVLLKWSGAGQEAPWFDPLDRAVGPVVTFGLAAALTWSSLTFGRWLWQQAEDELVRQNTPKGLHGVDPSPSDAGLLLLALTMSAVFTMALGSVVQRNPQTISVFAASTAIGILTFGFVGAMIGSSRFGHIQPEWAQRRLGKGPVLAIVPVTLALALDRALLRPRFEVEETMPLSEVGMYIALFLAFAAMVVIVPQRAIGLLLRPWSATRHYPRDFRSPPPSTLAWLVLAAIGCVAQLSALWWTFRDPDRDTFLTFGMVSLLGLAILAGRATVDVVLEPRFVRLSWWGVTVAAVLAPIVTTIMLF
jgi:hypothetical protein